MMPPSNCPYKELTAKPCWNCPQYIPDTDQCRLNPSPASQAATGYSAATSASSYEERLRRYEEDRKKLLEMSKESLVDMILKRPEMF